MSAHCVQILYEVTSDVSRFKIYFLSFPQFKSSPSLVRILGQETIPRLTTKVVCMKSVRWTLPKVRHFWASKKIRNATIFLQRSLYNLIFCLLRSSTCPLTSFFWLLSLVICAQTYLQLPLRQWGAGNVYFLVLSSWKVNITENPIAVMGL